MKRLSLALLVLTSCIQQRTIERRFGDELSSGRVISAEAYTRYARAAVLEAQGDFAQAAAEYRVVLELDPESVSAWARLGACLCASGKPSAEAFEQAQRIDPAFPEYRYEHALCLQRDGRLPEAQREAEHALRLAPLEFRYSELAVGIHEELGQLTRARQLLVASRIARPDAQAPRQALAAFGKRQGDSIALALSCCLSGDASATLGQNAQDACHRDSQGLCSATAASAVSGPSSAPLVERALCDAYQGKTDSATRHATTLLETDEDNGDAWVALLYAADLSHNSKRFSEALTRLSVRPRLYFELSRILFGEILHRRGARDAAAAWESAAGAEAAPRGASVTACANPTRALPIAETSPIPDRAR